MIPVRRLILVVVIVAALGAAVWYMMRPKSIAVSLGQADRGLVEHTVTNTRAGTVTACRRAKLAPPTGGQIAKLNVKKGDRVRAGQVLLELWNEDLSAQLQVARNQLESARSHAEESCLAADVAEREAERSKKLKDEGFISEERVDRAVSDAKVRRAACNASRADVRQSQSRIAQATAEKSRSLLTAPFAGVVADITGELGEFTTPSPPGIPTPPAIDLIDDSCLYVTAPMDEVDAPRISTGQKGRITVDALPGQKFPAHVRRVAPYVLDREKQARTVDVEVEFDDPAQIQTLLVGYSADVEIVLESKPDVLRVPSQALLEGNRLLVYRSDGKTEERTITPGLSNWQFTEVVSGLSADEKFVVSLERAGVKAGARLKPKRTAPEKSK